MADDKKKQYSRFTSFLKQIKNADENSTEKTTYIKKQNDGNCKQNKIFI
jgi:hypothetical protein